ncbi:MAG TPA: glycosyltransferase family 9 protein [Mariprofundaceae bacterium]|nr:glycosyltransferase family 9 protein [Mariprofundaceae bacterium]
MRALMVVCRYLGDVLLVTPLAQSLKEAGYAVDWIVASGTESLLEGQPWADRVSIAGPGLSWAGHIALGRQVFRRYEQAFVLPASDRPMAVAKLASKRVFALLPGNRKQDAWKRRFSYRWIPYEPMSHMVSYGIHMAALAGLPKCRDVRFHWSEEDASKVEAALQWKRSSDYVQLHPFARWPYKWWQRDRWRQLIDHLLDKGFKVAITGSPNEVKAAEDLAAGYADSDLRVLAGMLNWRQLACLAHHARLYVGLDTANTHLAAATDTPVVALYGPTDPRIWGPWPNGFAGRSPYRQWVLGGIQRASHISLMQGEQGCVPCQLEGCERHQQSASACLEMMDAERVWREMLYRLEAV